VITLSKGYQKPQTNDSGAEWFPALEDDIQRLNDHNHDGVNSELLTAASSVAVVQDVLAAAWTAFATDTYRQLVTLPILALPLSLSFDTCAIQFRTAAGAIIYPTVEKVTSTSYYVYINDNTLALKAVYTT
jgi:hypothetical protein